MATNFKVQDYQDGKQVIMPYSSMAKGLYFVEALIFLVGTIAFGILLITQWSDVLMASIIALLAVVAFSVGFYRFINKATEREKLFINKERLDIINSSLFKVNRKTFLLKDISDFRFLDKESYEPHPLKGETFDYLGFQSEQKIIQALHSEGRASFIYHGRQVRFGKELVSWEFSELEVLLYELTGNDLRYTDKYEQDNFPQQ